jgi:hypothetical protein
MYYRALKKVVEVNHHIAIIYKVNSDGSYNVIHQNIGVQDLNDSRVVISYSEHYKLKRSGTLRFIRPV